MGEFSQGSEGGFATNSAPYLSPVIPCSVCFYLRHLCGGDQSRTSQMSVCIAQAAPHAWRRQIRAVRPAWREMIHTDTHITSTSCTAQPSQPKWLIFISAAEKVLGFSDFVLSICITQVSNLKTAMIYCWDCRVKVLIFLLFFIFCGASYLVLYDRWISRKLSKKKQKNSQGVITKS